MRRGRGKGGVLVMWVGVLSVLPRGHQGNHGSHQLSSPNEVKRSARVGGEDGLSVTVFLSGFQFKQKRAKDKYRDQNEEEKQLMMEFLAVSRKG